MTRGDLEKALRTPPTMRGVLLASAVSGAVLYAITGGPWISLAIQVVFSCAFGALICWAWQRWARM